MLGSSGVGKISLEDKSFIFDEIARREDIDYKISVDQESEDEDYDEVDDDILDD